MAINIRKDLNVRYRLLQKSIEEIEKKLAHSSEGRINVREEHGNSYYYLFENKTYVKYLTSEDSEIIAELLQKNYLKKVLQAMKQELIAIEKMQKIYPEKLAEDVFDQLSDGRKAYTKPIVSADDSYAQKWMDTPYVHKLFKKGSPEFYTAKGERVRSKSEVIIADRLRANGIPYRYECPLKVGKKIIHPDFTILRMSDRRILYHEHCGKLGDHEYTEEMLTRANDYSQEGIILGDRLFYTFESDTMPLNVKLVDMIINTHYR